MPGAWLKGTRGAGDAAPDPRPQRRLFQLYTWTLGVAYAGVAAGIAGFFLIELRQDLQTEALQIRDQVERHAQFLETVIRSTADQVDTLRSVAASKRRPEACVAGRRQATQGPLKQHGPHFTWDAGADRSALGRLIGEGPLLARSDDFYCDLGAVLDLAPQLQAMATHQAGVGRAHFVSVHDFQFETPVRLPSPRLAGRMGAAQAEVWRLGQPQANPSRLKYWGSPHFGGVDLGLLVPVAAPVYEGDRFIGVVAVDMRLEALNRVNAAMGYAAGTVAVVDGKGRVLAHPTLAADPHRVRAPGHFEHVFPPQALPAPEALAAVPANQAVERAGWIVIRRPLASAPWQLVYTVPRAALWQALLLQRGPVVASALLVLGVVMVLVHAVTWRGFVGPAAQLAGHALAESNLKPQSVPRVPRAWRPWFDSVSRVFRESVHLGSLRREVDIAARLQQSILPRQWPEDPRFDLWGTMRPAKDIGGDFYDHFALPGGCHGMVVADVSGKGISAGLFGMVSKTLLRAIAMQRGHGTSQVAREVNEGLCADNESSMFVTTFYGQYDASSGRLVYANAGHPPPLVLRAQGQVQWLSGPGGPALGVVTGLTYQEGVVDLAPGDTLLVFTDGVTESINREGQEFGKKRLQDLFEGRPAARAQEAVERLLQEVERYAEGVEQFDDITCMALHCQGLGPAGQAPSLPV